MNQPKGFRIALLLLCLAPSAWAELSPDPAACDTPLSRSLQRARQDAIDGVNGNTGDALVPLIEYARDHRELLEKDEYDTYRTSGITSNLASELRQLEKAGCVDEITKKYFTAASYKMTFTTYDDVSFKREVMDEWPSIRTYWMNREHFSALLAERYPSPEKQAQIAALGKKLKKLYDRKVPGLGKVSVTDYLLLTFLRTDINDIAQPAIETVNLSTGESAKITVYNSRLEAPIEVELSPRDVANFAINYFDVSLKKLQKKKFSKHSLEMADSVVASFLIGDIDYESLTALLSMKDLKEAKKRFLKDLGQLTWGAAKVVLYQHPVTMPFMTLGALVYESIDRKKENENAQSNAARLIRR